MLTVFKTTAILIYDQKQFRDMLGRVFLLWRLYDEHYFD